MIFFKKHRYYRVVAAFRDAHAALIAFFLIYFKGLSPLAEGGFVGANMLTHRTANTFFRVYRHLFEPFMVGQRDYRAVRADVFAVSAADAFSFSIS